jgi:hypothetical protein
MADEPASTPADEASGASEQAVAAASEQAVAGARKTQGTGLVVMKEIRRARRLFRDDQTEAEANFVLSAANVLALVDLAAAVRETNAGADSDPA